MCVSVHVCVCVCVFLWQAEESLCCHFSDPIFVLGFIFNEYVHTSEMLEEIRALELYRQWRAASSGCQELGSPRELHALLITEPCLQLLYSFSFSPLYLR